ncbi:hypothetical protein DM02DRAFT_621617 [Periconia macrospinosa]|uniref:Uncharacterized protein n=1 Tax=Periconia macrospinosa TaxID=97972 RepID=A0A2V1EC21_9PLEO|nr:hypothetical protein DM02DRAFT_621617 [Periconia macrospinosa]
MSASSRGPPAVDLLWAYQLKKEHAYLKDELDSVKARSLKAERAAEAAQAASREVSELRKDLDEYINDPQEIERNKIVSDHLNEHTKQLATFNTRLNGLGDVVRSNEDDVDRLDGRCNAHEMKWNRFEERMAKLEKSLESSVNSNVCEALVHRTKALEHRVDRLTEHITRAINIHDTLQSFQLEYNHEIRQLKQDFAEMQETWQKAKSSGMVTQMPPVLQKPQVPQMEASRAPSLLNPAMPDTLSNFSWGYPLGGVGIQEHSTHQQAQILRFPGPAITETQATTQLDDSHNVSGIINESQELARIRPQQYEQASPRKKQKVSQDTQGEKLRQMLRGNELAIRRPPPGGASHSGGKQQGKASLTSYEATQRLELPKFTAHTAEKETDRSGSEEATQRVEPPKPATHPVEKEAKKRRHMERPPANRRLLSGINRRRYRLILPNLLLGGVTVIAAALHSKY